MGIVMSNEQTKKLERVPIDPPPSKNRMLSSYGNAVVRVGSRFERARWDDITIHWDTTPAKGIWDL